jgi:ribonucleoside-diphosphate reductase alpha chain
VGQLREDVMRYGIYNQNLQAVPPTGSISYINHATSSIHPIVSKLRFAKKAKPGAFTTLPRL